MPAFKRTSTQFLDDNGDPLLNGKLYVGSYGLDPVANPITIYSDVGLTTPLTNPQTLDSFGRPANDIYIGVDFSYKVEDSGGTQIELKDVDFTVDSNEVSFDQGVTGSVSRTLQSRLSDVVSVKDFGATGDGSTDDTAAIQAAIDYCAALASSETWFEDDRGTDVATWGSTVELYFPPGLYLISSGLTVAEGNKNLIISNATLKATGVGWATTDYMLAGSDSNSTYITVQNSRFNCANKCGGMHAKARWRILKCHIERVAGVGVYLNGSDAWIDQCIIGQWTTFDDEFYLQANYTGVGIECPYNDVRITNCVVRWLYECVRISHTNIFMADCHLFNGMENFAEYDSDGTYVGGGAGDAVGRTYAALIVVEAPTGERAGSLNHVSVNHCYLDNGTIELYDNSVHFNGCMFVANSAHVPNNAGTTDYWIRCDAKGISTTLRVIVTDPIFWVTSLARKILYFTASGGNSWGNDVSALEASSINQAITDNNGVEISPRQRFGSLALSEAFAFTNAGAGCKIKFSDDNTTSDSTRPEVGSLGDDLSLQGDDIFAASKYMSLTNSAGSAQFAARANLGEDASFELYEATADGGATYTNRGRWKYDSSGGRAILQSSQPLSIQVAGNDMLSVTATRPTVTGSKGGNAALASLITVLAGLDLINDSTT